MEVEGSRALRGENEAQGRELQVLRAELEATAQWKVRRCTLEYPFVWRKGVLNGYSSTRVSLFCMVKWVLKGVLEYARLAMGFANVRAPRYGIR